MVASVNELPITQRAAFSSQYNESSVFDQFYMCIQRNNGVIINVVKTIRLAKSSGWII